MTKNNPIYQAFDRLSPEPKTSEKMLENIMERAAGAGSTEQEARKGAFRNPLLLKILLPAAAVLILLAGTVFLLRGAGLFRPSEYKVRLQSGDTVVFSRDAAASAEAKIAPPYDVESRMLTQDEFMLLALRKTPGMYCSAAFKKETGGLVALEGSLGDDMNLRINMSVPEIAVTDTLISGNPGTSQILGVPVKTAYFRTNKTAGRIPSTFFSAMFTVDDISIYITASGPTSKAGKISRDFASYIEELIRHGRPAFDEISY